MPENPIFFLPEKHRIYDDCNDIVKSMRPSRYPKPTDREQHREVNPRQRSKTELCQRERRPQCQMHVDKNYMMMRAE